MEIINRGEVVGRLSDCVPDMWYFEGRFTPAETPAGTRFVAAASALEPGAASNDPAKGIRTLLREAVDDIGTVFIVMQLAEGRLFGRRVLVREAVAWAEANVPE